MGLITIRIFASHPVANLHYARLLSSQDDFCMVSDESPFEVGIFDAELVSLDAALTLFRARFPSMRPLLLASCCKEEECLRWLLRGIWGLVRYDRYEVDLPLSVRQVAGGHLWYPAPVVARWMQANLTQPSPTLQPSLTDRERQVMEFLLRRFSNKEIADILNISERTVKFHVANIMAKLHVSSRLELVALWAPTPDLVC